MAARGIRAGARRIRPGDSGSGGGTSGSGRDGLLRVGDGGSTDAMTARRTCRGAELRAGTGAAEQRGSLAAGCADSQMGSMGRAFIFFVFFSINRGGRLTASENPDLP